MNQPIGATSPEPHEYKVSDRDEARVYELVNPPSPEALQEIATLVRSVADLQRLFVYNTRKTLAMRGRAEFLELAAWLIKELDRPVNGTAVHTAEHEYRLPEDASPRDGGTVVRVFYLRPQSADTFYQAISLVRANAHIPRIFGYSTLHAIGVRGTPGQIATAEKTIEEIGKAQSQPQL